MKPTTTEEFLALPIGPIFDHRVIELSDDDRAAGYVIVDGRRLLISGKAQRLRLPIMPKVQALHFEATDIISCRDAEGVSWTLGRYQGDDYFRRRQN